MIKFNKPANLNGAELRTELNAVGIEMLDSPFIDGAGDFWLPIADKDKVKALAVVAAHNGTTIAPELTVAQKLAAIGLTVQDLQALGL